MSHFSVRFWKRSVLFKWTNGLMTIHIGSRDRPLLSLMIKIDTARLITPDPYMYGSSTLDLSHFVVVKWGQPGKKQKWTKLWETDNENSKAWIIINILCNIWDKSLFVVQELNKINFFFLPKFICSNDLNVSKLFECAKLIQVLW